MKRKPYPTDLTDEQWKLLETILPPSELRGRKREVDLREIVNAILYLLVEGIRWRSLPHDFPNWQTVYYYFRKWRDADWWRVMNQTLRQQVRIQAGRDPEPSKVKGRKRHILVDTLGLLLVVKVHAANIQDRDGAKLLLEEISDQFPRLELIWADGGYAGKLIDWVAVTCLWLLVIVKRNAEAKGFYVLPKRWIVERTLAWRSNCRRLSKDYERLPETSEAFCYLAMIRLMLKRLAPASV